MHTTFNLQRLGKLIANEFCLNLKKMLITLGSMLGFVVIYFVFFLSQNEPYVHVGSTIALFFLASLVFQGIITSTYFSDFSSKPQTISLLLLPASNLEKFTAKFIFSMIIPPIILLGYVYLAAKFNIEFNRWASGVYGVFDSTLIDTKYLKNLLEDKLMPTLFATIWFASASGFLCGAQIFKKKAAIKTFLIMIASIVLSSVFMFLLYLMVTGRATNMFFPFVFISEKGLMGYTLMEEYEYFLQFLFLFVGAYLVVVSWFKFNEKTI